MITNLIETLMHSEQLHIDIFSIKSLVIYLFIALLIVASRFKKEIVLSKQSKSMIFLHPNHI